MKESKQMQKDKLKQLFIDELKPEFKAAVVWLMRWDMLPLAKVKAFLCFRYYHQEIEKTKLNGGLKYGDKKQAIAKVQERIPLSLRQIQNILKK